jgi:ATP-binding cassette subfamily B protein
MDRQGFDRALDFFRYSRVAAWTALTASVLTGFVFVALLVLLGLFFDLCVNEGKVPSLARLPARERAEFIKSIQLPANAEAREELVQEFIGRVRELKLGDPGLSRLAAAHDLETLGEAARELRRDLLWMAELPHFYEEAVSPAAADAVRDALRMQVEKYGAGLAISRDLDDLGGLGLVARTRSSYQRWFIRPLVRWNEWTWKHGSVYYLQGLLIMAFVLTIFRAFLFYAGNILAARAIVETVTRLRRALYLQTYRLGTLAFRSLGPSEAVGVSTRHLESVHEGLFLWLTTELRETVKFGLVFLFALLVDFWLAMVLLLLAGLVWLVVGQLAAHFRTQVNAAERATGEQLALLQESLMLMRLVKVYLMEPFNQGRFEKQLAAYAAAQSARYWGEALYRGLFRALAIFAALTVLYLAGRVMLDGSLGVTSALIMTVALVSLYWPAVAWLDARRKLRRARDSAKTLFEFLDRPGSVGQAGDAEFLPALSKSLEFESVSLKEPGTGKRLLSGVSLSIKAGQKVALVGPDEMEKHALVYLLSRFLDPAHGQIRIDKKNIREVTLDSLRVQVATVLQHNLIYNDTVANNIACGDPSFNSARIIEAAKVAHAHQFVQKLPKGYDTVIGDLGHPLSPSEKFRIGLTRAIVRDPALLVIEEPVGALDDDTKAMIDDTFSRILHGRTVLFLPHRVSTLKSCDRVFFLHEGKIVDQGEHRELLQANDLYRHLQYLEFNEFAGLFTTQQPASNPEIKI